MDISSPNIVLDEQKNARLIDFGLTLDIEERKRIGCADAENTDISVLGTKGYYLDSDTTISKYLDYHSFGVGKSNVVLKLKDKILTLLAS